MKIHFIYYLSLLTFNPSVRHYMLKKLLFLVELDKSEFIKQIVDLKDFFMNILTVNILCDQKKSILIRFIH